MSRDQDHDPEPLAGAAAAGLSAEQAAVLGRERAAQVRSFRLIPFIGQQLRHLADQLYRADGLTHQQAALLTLVRTRERPSLSEIASAMYTSHQNVKQLVAALVDKGFLRLRPDARDGRVKRLQVTARSDRYWASRDADDFEHVARWFKGLDAREVEQLYALLVKLENGLKDALGADSSD